MTTIAEPKTAVHALQCMEIWGGNQAHDNGVSVPGIDAWVYSLPHAGGRAGGDIHYVSMCGGGKISRFAVADVSGHGEQVDALAVKLRSLMRRYINTLNQARFARALNEEFSKLAAGGAFATAVLATYYAPNDHLVVVNAGHPAPLWYRAAAGTWRKLVPEVPGRADEVSNLPLGIISPTTYHQFAAPLGLGDLVLIYTDSLIEASSPKGEMLGEEGLLKVVRGLDAGDPQQLHLQLRSALDDYRGGAAAEDDVTILLLHHNASDPRRKTPGEFARVLGKMTGLIRV